MLPRHGLHYAKAILGKAAESQSWTYQYWGLMQDHIRGWTRLMPSGAVSLLFENLNHLFERATDRGAPLVNDNGSLDERGMRSENGDPFLVRQVLLG